jgi:PAS domain S-box-containing protein
LAIQRKQADEALKESESRYRQLLEKTDVGFVVIDDQGIVTEANEPYLHLVGAEVMDEIIGHSVIEWTALEARDSNFAAIELCSRQGYIKDFETIYLHRNGMPVNITVDATVRETDAGKRLLSFCRNITERKQAEVRIETQLRRIESLNLIDIAIANSFDVRLALKALVDAVVKQLDVDAAAVLLFKPFNNTLEFFTGQGFRTNLIDKISLRLGEGLAGRAALERKRLYIPNLAEVGEECKRAALIAGEAFVAYFGIPLIAKGQIKGVLEIFHRTPISPDGDWVNFLETLAGQAAVGIDSAQSFEELQRSNINLSLAYDATIEGWSRAMDLRDKETEGHTQRVADMTVQLARAMGLIGEQIVHIRRGALLHDMGKLGVPDHILLKPGELTDEEWVQIHRHPQHAYEMLASIEYLRPALDIPYCHHEKWDGTGYPRGLKGEFIPIAARIFAVVDVWDALLSDRPYRDAWPEEKVLEYLKAGSGTHFDPRVVDTFFQIIKREIDI